MTRTVPTPLANLAFTADSLAGAEAPPRPWHVPDLIPAMTVTLCQGDGGTGKTLLALQLAAATALGRSWIGHDARRGNVIYLSAEDDRDELHRRLVDIAQSYDADLADLAGLKVIPLAGHDAVLASTSGRNGLLAPTPLWSELEALSTAWEPVLIVLDNLADVFAGEENSRSHARQFVGMLRGVAIRTGAAVLLIGHPSLSGLSSGSGSSGSTAWNNSVRSRLYLAKPAPADGVDTDPDLRILTVKKANYAATGGELRIRWHRGAFALDGGVVAGQPDLDRASAHARIDSLFLQLLAESDAAGRVVSDKTGANYAPAIFAKSPRANGTTKGGFAAAMERLFAAGEIIVTTTGPASKRRSQLVRTDPGRLL
jgi:RecA-family ATPase